jgi:hypothetical protein
MSRDPLFTRPWTELLESSGVKCLPIPAQSPNCNGYAQSELQRLRGAIRVKTTRAECLDHFVIFG